MKLLILLVALALVVPTASGARASSSEWFEMEGARIRLVTAGAPDAGGRLKGALDIELKPGWKTYWRDPGDAGVPPTIDVSANPGLTSATFEFPAPQRHDEGDFQWAGYDYPVRLPVTFTLGDPAKATTIDANVFLGVCETICVPVQTTLRVDLSHDADNPAHRSAVVKAFAAIPQPATPEFGVKMAGKQPDGTILLDASFPGSADGVDLFIAGDHGYTFTTPVRHTKDGKTFFSTEVSHPASIPEGDGLHYTLVTAEGSVDGFLPYF